MESPKSKLIMSDIKLNYDDITVIPEIVTDISSRKQCNPYDEDGYLPIFAAPMSSVVSIENAHDFNNAKIKAVIPRSYSINERLSYLSKNTDNFVAFSLSEANEIFNKEDTLLTVNTDSKIKICIDLANGHMCKLLELVRSIKTRYGDKMIIMTGNIANPETYIEYEKAGVDYVRVGIGGGSVCSTASNTSIFFPYFSLIKEIYEIKKNINGKCKIIADGNIKGFRDIQKALIYSDYVMIGGIFNKAIESAGKTTYGNRYWNIRGKKIFRPLTSLFTYGKQIKKEDYSKCYKLFKDNKLSIWKELYGQSTKIAQALMASANSETLKTLKTSEGLLRYQKVEYNLSGWAENETDYLRSAMSYTNSKTLEEYKGSQWVKITKIAYNN